MPRITTWAQLDALVNSAVERADLEFKKHQPSASDQELAKDVAAMANGLGGSIVIGASADGNLCSGLPGITLTQANALAVRYEQAADARCRPRVALDCAFVSLPNSSNRLLIVNVAASHIVPVGINLRDLLLSDAWIFPLRMTSHTVWLSPDQFGGLDNMAARRTGALLSGIPEAEREQIKIRADHTLHRASGESRAGGAPHVVGPLYGRLCDDGVDYVHNVAHFCVGRIRAGRRWDLRIPLDWIGTVWRDSKENCWWVITSGVFIGGDTEREREPEDWEIVRFEQA